MKTQCSKMSQKNFELLKSGCTLQYKTNGTIFLFFFIDKSSLSNFKC